MWQHFDILGSGHYLPQPVMAEEIDNRLGKPPGWVREHVGVITRYECRQPDTLATMAHAAAQRALADAKIGLEQLDLVIDASTCRHQPIPCNAAFVQAALGGAAHSIPCFDVQSTCLGFLVALQVANGLFATGTYQHILITCSEAGLLGVNWNDAESAALIGDGAAAVILRRRAPTPTFFYAHETYTEYLTTCQIAGGGHRLPPYDYQRDRDAAYRFAMDGPRVFRVALRHLPPMVQRLLNDAHIEPDMLQVIPHQASPHAVEAIRRRLGFTPEQYHSHVAQIGNIAAAGIPLVFHRTRQSGLLPPGQRVMLLGTSAGYSQAALLFQV